MVYHYVIINHPNIYRAFMKLKYSKIFLFYNRRYLLLTYRMYTKDSILFSLQPGGTSLLLLPDAGALTWAIIPILVTASFGNLQWSEGIFAVSIILPQSSQDD